MVDAAAQFCTAAPASSGGLSIMLLILMVVSCLACTGAFAFLALVFMRNSSVTERIQQLEGHSREVKDRLAGLVTRSEGESAEWLNSLIENFFWTRMLLPAWERDLRAEVDAQLTGLLNAASEPDTVVKVPGWIKTITVDKLTLGSIPPVITRARCVKGNVGTIQGASLLDLDASFTTDKLEVQLSAGLQGKVTNALDWIGNIAGALAQADNTTLAIMIRQIHVTCCVRIAILPNSDIMLIGVIAKPKVACRLGVDAAFKSRVGTVGVPVTKIPGVVDFLEGIVNKALTANLVWPRADVRDMDSYERDRSQPGTGRLRVQVLGAEALPPEKVKATAETMAKAEKEAAVAPPSPSKPARDGSAAGYRVAAAKFSSGVFDCTVKWQSGRKRRDVEVPSSGKAARESDAVVASMSEWPPGGDTKEAIEFSIRNREEVPKNTPQDKFAAGIKRALAERGVPMPEASVGGAMVKVLRLNGDATILLTTLGGSPSLTVITPTGKADERMVARGLAVSPLPGAAELHLEVLPPGAEPGDPPVGFLRVRVEVEWDKAGAGKAGGGGSLQRGQPSSASTASAAAAAEMPAGGGVGPAGGSTSVWDLAVEGSADDFELPPAL